ncbi:plasmid pRiA4b ORF-3 family protein [Streptomyces sp. NPDC001774]
MLEIKVTLMHVRPAIWRRLQVPADIPLDRLHEVIQTAMGWKDRHTHLFATPTGDYGTADRRPPSLDESTVSLSAVAPAAGDTISYTYDLGDDWAHRIEVERCFPAEPGTRYPRCLTGRRACPPEDCGGPSGYAEFVAAVINPRHALHAELAAGTAHPFDPDYLDIRAINNRLASGTSFNGTDMP